MLIMIKCVFSEDYCAVLEEKRRTRGTGRMGGRIEIEERRDEEMNESSRK